MDECSSAQAHPWCPCQLTGINISSARTYNLCHACGSMHSTSWKRCLQALNRQSLPLGVAVLRSRDAACMEDIDGDTVKALDFGGRVTVASTKNLQLQVGSKV